VEAGDVVVADVVAQRLAGEPAGELNALAIRLPALAFPKPQL
jgi:hypothetical protein